MSKRRRHKSAKGQGTRVLHTYLAQGKHGAKPVRLIPQEAGYGIDENGAIRRIHPDAKLTKKQRRALRKAGDL